MRGLRNEAQRSGAMLKLREDERAKVLLAKVAAKVKARSFKNNSTLGEASRELHYYDG